MIKILFVIIFLWPVSAFGENIEPFVQLCHDGYTYAPDKDIKPVVMYADMDGDRKDEAIIAIQMHSIDGNDYPRSFAYVYKTENDGNPKDLLQTFPLNEYLGVLFNEEHEKIIEVIDLNRDGKKEAAIWSTGGLHYHSLVIIGMQDNKVATLFNNGSNGQIEYNPDKKIIRIERINIDDPKCIWNDIKFLWETWEWDGKEFLYNKEKSTSPPVGEDEENDKVFKLASRTDFHNTPYEWVEAAKLEKEWEYRFKRMNRGAQ